MWSFQHVYNSASTGKTWAEHFDLLEKVNKTTSENKQIIEQYVNVIVINLPAFYPVAKFYTFFTKVLLSLLKTRSK